MEPRRSARVAGRPVVHFVDPSLNTQDERALDLANDDVSQYILSQYDTPYDIDEKTEEKKERELKLDPDYNTESSDESNEESDDENIELVSIDVPLTHTTITEHNPPWDDFLHYLMEFKEDIHEADIPLAFIDVEWHSMKRIPQLISQISAVSIDGTIRHNTYIKYKDLHEDWMELVKLGIVTIDKQDSEEGITMCQSIQLLMYRFPKNTIFLFAGNVDGPKIAQSIYMILGKNTNLMNQIKEHGFRFLSVNSILIPEFKALGFQKLLCTPTGSSIKRVYQLFDVMFFKYLIVKGAVYRPDVLDKPDAASLEISHTTNLLIEEPNALQLLTKDIIWSNDSNFTESMDVQYRTSRHIQPQFHYADTDVMILRDIVAFWFIYRANKRFVEISRGDSIELGYAPDGEPFTIPPASFCELSTLVVQQSKYLRHHLFIEPECIAWIRKRIVELPDGKVYTLKEKLEELEANIHSFASTTTIESREQALLLRKRNKKNNNNAKRDPTEKFPKVSIILSHGAPPTNVTLFTQSTNRSKIEALRLVVNSESNSFNDAFEEHEHLRLTMGLEPVGDKPYYFSPAAFGTKLDNTTILHSKYCDLFRLKGDSTGLKKKRAAGSVKLSSINIEAVKQFGLPMLTRFIFCKECKHYFGDPTTQEVTDPEDENSTILISYVDLFCKPVDESVCIHDSDISTWEFNRNNLRPVVPEPEESESSSSFYEVDIVKELVYDLLDRKQADAAADAKEGFTMSEIEIEEDNEFDSEIGEGELIELTDSDDEWAISEDIIQRFNLSVESRPWSPVSDSSDEVSIISPPLSADGSSLPPSPPVIERGITYTSMPILEPVRTVIEIEDEVPPKPMVEVELTPELIHLILSLSLTV